MRSYHFQLELHLMHLLHSASNLAVIHLQLRIDYATLFWTRIRTITMSSPRGRNRGRYITIPTSITEESTERKTCSNGISGSINGKWGVSGCSNDFLSITKYRDEKVLLNID